MTLTQFFRECRELVKVRWLVNFHHSGAILLVPILECMVEGPFRAQPILALAVDMYGECMKSELDMDTVATALEIKLEVARILVIASLFPNPEEPMKEVRAELIRVLSGPNKLLT